MPLTPLHPVPVWLPYVRWPRAFSFWALTFGSMANDLEYVFAFLTTGHLTHGRGIMHSVLGVLTINALATIVFVYLFVPPFLRWVERRWPTRPDLFRFAGQDLRRDPRDLLTVYTCAAFGGLTHILIDLPTHGYNPLLWPWQQVPLKILPFADDPLWTILAGIPVLLALLWLIRRYWRH